MVRILGKNSSNYTKYYLDKNKPLNCTIDNINYKMLCKIK